jgi:hypothetical protein
MMKWRGSYWCSQASIFLIDKMPFLLSRPPHSPTSQTPAHHGTLDTLGLLLGALPCPLEEHYQVDLHIMRSQHRVRLEDARYLKGRGGGGRLEGEHERGTMGDKGRRVTGYEMETIKRTHL